MWLKLGENIFKLKMSLQFMIATRWDVEVKGTCEHLSSICYYASIDGWKHNCFSPFSNYTSILWIVQHDDYTTCS
jgi:hypothetical protein